MLDHTVTKRNWYDFFLVSQHVGQGTVTPTHYVVVQDTLDLPVDAVQRIRLVVSVVLSRLMTFSASYKLTHMYFNWPGTVRVPAPCQYAHKVSLSSLQSYHLQLSGTFSSPTKSGSIFIGSQAGSSATGSSSSEETNSSRIHQELFEFFIFKVNTVPILFCSLCSKSSELFEIFIFISYLND